MALFKDIVTFRDDLYFEGAVQADWFYQQRQLESVVTSFVFHGPNTHAVSKNDFSERRLLDTASFTLKIAEKATNSEAGSPLTLAIAGYGTGKSHLAVTLSALFSGEAWHPDLHTRILENIARADKDISEKIRLLVKKPRLVLTINGMRDFNLHYELLRTAEKALRMYGSGLDVLTKLNKVKETATNFVDRSYDLWSNRAEQIAAIQGINLKGEALREYLITHLDNQQDAAFVIVNQVYEEFNGHSIRLDEGVSASAILETLVQECCGLHGQFDGIIILFDEFGRYLEYVGANPAAAGDSALQQIFEAVQNADGDIQFVGFIQSDIKSYLQRVDKTSNISRYIDRYDAGEKIYLSSNLETIFANLLEKKDTTAYSSLVLHRQEQEKSKWHELFNHLQIWLKPTGVWASWPEFQKVILGGIYPLHPISTYLLCNLTDWLQSRSSLTLLSEKISLMGSIDMSADQPLSLIYPVDLLIGSFFSELLNAEESGRQRSQFCILLNNIYKKYDTKLTDDAHRVLLANLIVRICRMNFATREELMLALEACSGLSTDAVDSAVNLLENEYAIFAYDDRLVCFDFVADSVGANEFRNHLRTLQNRMSFRPSMLNDNDILELGELDKPVETDFGAKHGIQTREWQFIQLIDHISQISQATLSSLSHELRQATLPNQEKGRLLWIYAPKETSTTAIDNLILWMGQSDSAVALSAILIDDAENKLQDAILAYRVLADMSKDDQLRYQHFYVDAFLKAKEKVHLQFLDLKKERKVISAAGVAPSLKRLKAHLTSVFETIYPKAIPFDFDGFDTKNASGAGYKNFCSIMKWILIDHMAYTSLKSQSVEVRNRVESVLGMNGVYSWRALDNKYKGIQPANPQASAIYAKLDSLLSENKAIPFKKISSLLTAAPFGMNEYAIFMLLGLFSENLGYTTKLEMDGQKYNTEAWADAVLQDKRFDVKAFEKTKLLLVDVGETTAKFRYLYKQIKNNTDFSKGKSLQEQLDKLKMEESLPEVLEAEDTLAIMYLSEAMRAFKWYNDKADKIASDLHVAGRTLNPYSALMCAVDAEKMLVSPPGRFQYSPEQLDELNGYVTQAKQIARAGFDDGWIKTHRCTSTEKLLSYQSFSRKAEELFNHYGFTEESLILAGHVAKEVKRINMIIAQEALYKNSISFIAASVILPGATKKTLSGYQKQGQKLLQEYSTFDYAQDKSFVDVYGQLQRRLTEIEKALQALKQQQDALWNAIYDISSIDDVRHIVGQIQALLGSGLEETDRADFEEIDTFLRQFLNDIEPLVNLVESREELESVRNHLLDIYNEDSELSMESLIKRLVSAQYDRIDKLEEQWKARYLTLTAADHSQAELDQWKKETQPLPLYVSNNTKQEYALKLTEVEGQLSKARKDYIVFLFNQLSDNEKNAVLEQLSKG